VMFSSELLPCDRHFLWTGQECQWRHL
jgi:hypothetical protein